jgi:glycosyltransferase involved in cell wall biosynthesis
MRPTTAILINNRNNASHVRQCVDSALAQTSPADEIVVYDDESDDGAREILRGYGNRITLIEGSSTGIESPRLRAAHAIHQSVRHSSAEWCFLLDGDDWFLPEKLERYLAAITENEGLSLVQAPMIYVDDGGAVLGEYREPRFHAVDDHWREVFRRRECDFFYPTGALAVHRGVLDAELPLDFSRCPYLASDFRIAMLAMYHGRILTLEEPLTCWRRHAASISLKNATSRFYLLRMLTARALVFNFYARKRGCPEIRWWTNPRVFKRLLGSAAPRGLLNGLRERKMLRT